MNTAARAFTPDPEGDIICHCAAVSQDDLTLAYRRLAQGDRTLGALCRSTGAGLTCGGCVARIGDILGRDTMVAARLTAKEALDDTHFALTFTPHFARHRNDGGVAQDALFAFRMGAQVHRRTFTLVDQDPVTGSVQIVIKREPNGLVSRWLADAARIGTAVEVSTPFGGLRDAGTSQPVFLAAGIGITPALSVIQAKQAGQARILWWVRSAQAPGLMAHVRAQAAHAGVNLTVFDTSSSAPRADADLLRASLSPGQDRPHICGPQGFVDKVMNSLDDLRWPTGDRHVASFVYTPGQGAKARTEPRHREISFEPLRDAIRTPSFHLRPAEGIAARMREARAFLHQFYHEIGADEPMQARLDHIAGELRRTGTYHQTEAELGFGARLAWRNANRCIGRFFWQSLTVRDKRDIGTEGTADAIAQAVFEDVLTHLRFATNGGDLRPAISVYAAQADIFIENGQLILYAGYSQADGSVLGDPKNVALTQRAQRLGWSGTGTAFDALPLMIRVGGRGPFLFEIPPGDILEVPITHPEVAAVGELGLKWFAVPAVANMALDLGGLVYGAAPSNGFYMGTEIGSFNLADPRRYDRLGDVARAIGLTPHTADALWRDRALVEINRAVLHSFRQAGVRIQDHYELSQWFDRFRADETRKGRPVFGHWPWIVPPMGGNLHTVWHDASLRNVILKPGYFYQKDAALDA